MILKEWIETMYSGNVVCVCGRGGRVSGQAGLTRQLDLVCKMQRYEAFLLSVNIIHLLTLNAI